MTHSKIDPIAIAKSELADAKAQRDKAQQDLNTANMQMQQAQANGNAARDMILTASGAIQQGEAYLRLLTPAVDTPKDLA